MQKEELTPEEQELIEAIRNLRKAYPNGYKKLLFYTQQIFDALIDLP